MSDELELTVAQMRKIINSLNKSISEINIYLNEAKEQGLTQKARNYRKRIKQYQVIRDKMHNFIN